MAISANDAARIRKALGQSCLMLSGEASMTKQTVEAHLRDALDCINIIDTAYPKARK